MRRRRQRSFGGEGIPPISFFRYLKMAAKRDFCTEGIRSRFSKRQLLDVLRTAGSEAGAWASP